MAGTRGGGLRCVFNFIKAFEFLHSLGSPPCSRNIITVHGDYTLSAPKICNGPEVTLGTLIQEIDQPSSFSSTPRSQDVLA